ncbi:MAG: fibronectin type III domain-containing protein [Chloroflexi bacterium]|nr:fibronectin type III domain-containing protein [Chloroflexota bacterium]
MTALSAPANPGTLPLLLRKGPATWFICILLIAAPSMYAARIWLDSGQSWLHPELFATSAYIWNFPETETFGDRLRKALDWKAFDPNVNRVRPLNDLAETADAIARPFIARYVVPQPSITPTALLTAVVTPVAVMGFLLRDGVSGLRAASITGVLISSVGFLSVLIPYIRPAKKLVFLFLAASIWFAFSHRRTKSSSDHLFVVASLLLGFFSDEMGLIAYPAVALLFPSMFLRASKWKAGLFASLPVIFLLVTYVILPFVYIRFSVHGAWDAIGDGKKLEILRYLFDPSFYRVSAIHIADAFLTTFGIEERSWPFEAVALSILFGAPLIALLIRVPVYEGSPSHGLVASGSTVLLSGIYTTLLDWYPFPGQVSYLGSFTFYYHSSMSIFLVVWLYYLWGVIISQTKQYAILSRVSLFSGIILCVLIMFSNFRMFQRINDLTRMIHVFPYTSLSIFSEIENHLNEIRAAAPGTPIRVEFQRDPEGVIREFSAKARDVFGERWQDNDYSRTFMAVSANPIMKDFHLEALLHAFFPYNSFDVQIMAVSGEQPEPSGVAAGTSPAPANAPPTVPEALQATIRPGGNVLLTWRPVAGATEVRVERRDGAGFPFQELGVTGPGSSGHLNTSLTSGVEYAWRLRACNSLGCSPYSPEVAISAP